MPRLRNHLWAVVLLALVAGQWGCQRHHHTDSSSSSDTARQPAARTTVSDGMVRSSVAYPTGERATSALLLERMAPASVSVGQPFDYTYKVTNISKSKLEDVVVSENNPEGFDMDSASPAGQKIDGGMMWDLGDLAAGQTKTITVSGSASGVGTLANCATAEYARRACLTVNVVQPSLELVKTMTPRVIQCDVIKATYTVTNNGSGDATNVVIVDNLPDGLRTASNAQTVRAEVGTLPAGQTRSYTIDLRATRTGEFTNNATATGDGGLESESSAKTLVVKPELEIDKTGPERVFIGRDVTYTIKVANTGNGEARDTVVTDQLPAGVTLVSSEPAATVTGGRLSWNLGTLNADAARTLTVTVRPTAQARLTNTATANAYCADPVNDSVVTQVVGIPAVLLEVIDVTDPVEVGEQTTYVIKVTNQGSAPDRDIKIVANLENTMSFVAGQGATGLARQGQVVEFTPLDSLAPGAEAVWRVTVKAERAGDVRFKVTMTTDELTRPVEETEATNFYE